MDKDVFKYKSIDEGQRNDIEAIRQNAEDLLHAIVNNCPDGRRKSLAITNLEQCVMFANKSISHG